MSESIKLETVIGLEVHAQLKTRSKLFCSCSVDFGGGANTRGCPVCLGMPGTLPVLNKKAVELAVRLALAVGAKVNTRSVFARKNYFYPDLPKGYQISQYEEPISKGGFIEIDDNEITRKVSINRIHMEEDAGKLVHDQHETLSLFDVNRCGTPLIEIVSEPEIQNPRQAFLYLVKLRQILKYLEICDGNMEEGSLRCDANLSLRRVGEKKLGVKTELKNMNSFHNVEKALEYEVKRQSDVINNGGHVVQETLLWDVSRGKTNQMRTKEEAHDYRYFPEPDLLPLIVSDDWIREVAQSLPELPERRQKRLCEEYGIPDYDSCIITAERETADFYEDCVKFGANPKKASNWIMGDILRLLNEEKLDTVKQIRIKPENLAELIKMQEAGTISGKIAKIVFEEMGNTGGNPHSIINQKGLLQISDTSEIEVVIDNIINDNKEQAARFEAGAGKLMGFFVGEVMKATQGKANPKIVNQILMVKLKKNQ
ncbi:MAG: Asp-tRNA(Asn)/Glu-tRNA(Gln) amidotransferase subunit GatB [bacterium]